MLARLKRFLKNYRLLGFVIIVSIVGLALELSGNSAVARWLLSVTALIAVLPLLKDMLETLRSGEYGIDILAATAIITAVLLGEYWAAMVIVLMLTGGEALEKYAQTRAKSELNALLERRPKTAHLLSRGKTLDVSVSEVSVGDKVRIFPGEIVPVDAEIIEGHSSLDESSLTGESLPAPKSPGDTVLSGSVNIEGALTVKTIHTAADSQYEQIIKLVRAAASSQSPFVRMADRYSVPFTAVAYIVAGSAWIVSGDPMRFLQVMVVATPCPLILAAPIALVSGMSRSAKHGIIVKNGTSLERLAEIETVAFDKTGTLTSGVLSVDDIKTFGKYTKTEILTFAAALEQNSHHIIARAVLDEAAKQNVKVKAAKQAKELAGLGLAGHHKGKRVMIGRYSLLEEKGVALPARYKPNDSKQTAVYIAVNEELVGTITFKDEVRSEAKPMLERLQKLGIKHSLMVTGDNKATAQAVANTLGIKQVEAECLPADKIHVIEKVKERPVAFVGDGINDAPVLTAADIGIALGARGSTAASESADVVVMLDDVGKVATVIEIAQRTFSIARQSILIGIFISIGLMGVFWTGRFSALQGAFLQEVVDIIVIFNALRAHSS